MENGENKPQPVASEETGLLDSNEKRVICIMNPKQCNKLLVFLAVFSFILSLSLLSIPTSNRVLIEIGSCGVLYASNISSVWVNNGGDKVSQDELRATNNPANVLNSVWDGNKVSVFGAKNEVVAFNLILEASTDAATNVTLSFDTLTGPGGASISSVSTSGDGVFNWVNRNIELFYIRYLKIKGLSTDLFYSNYDERHIPERFRRPWTGNGEGSGTWEDRPDHNKFYPDIAIPIELISGFNIDATQNQSIWIDIYIPKTAAAGLYKGTITIKEDSSVTHAIPVELTVYNFTLPDLPNARTMLYYSIENINYRYLGQEDPNPGTDCYTQSLNLADRHFQLAHRHKISLIDNVIEIEKMSEAWTDRLNGDLFTQANDYDGVGVGIGNNIFSIGTYGTWPWQGGTKADMWTNTDAWVNWFKNQAFSTPTEYFLYLIDESDDYAQIEEWAQWINSNPGPGRDLMSMATISLPIAVANTPSLDIPTAWMQVGVTETWQSAADSLTADTDQRLYLYNGNRPASGTFAIEDDGIALRVSAWAQYKKKVDRWFYWESTYYNNYQGNTGQTNVFQKAQTFGDFEQVDGELGETGWNYLNGDGVLFYPGTDTLYPSDSYGVNGPFASLRVKHLRRGIQDVDYLTLAAAVNPSRTAAIVEEIIPKVLWEYGVDDIHDPTWVLTDITWSNDPDTWEAARAELADIIEGGSSFYPIPNIKANGTDGPITVSVNNPVSITVVLESGDYAGQNADWWVAAYTPFDWFSYVFPSGWVAGINLCIQFPLFELSPAFEVLNIPLPIGDYIFYFAVDNNADGVPDASWWDYVEVHVQE